MTKVKICGISRLEDISYVNKLLPDYIGLVFASSKRQVIISQAKDLIKALDKNVKTVGVFVNEDCDKVRSISKLLKLDILQFHGNEDEEYIKNFNDFTIWKSLSINIVIEKKIIDNQKKIDNINNFAIDAILLDSYIKGTNGGSGKSFDWSIIENLNIRKNIILAGGLNLENITKAINMVKPCCVDISSGVESNGIKSFEKMKKFINKVRLLK